MRSLVMQIPLLSSSGSGHRSIAKGRSCLERYCTVSRARVPDRSTHNVLLGDFCSAAVGIVFGVGSKGAVQVAVFSTSFKVRRAVVVNRLSRGRCLAGPTSNKMLRSEIRILLEVVTVNGVDGRWRISTKRQGCRSSPVYTELAEHAVTYQISVSLILRSHQTLFALSRGWSAVLSSYDSSIGVISSPQDRKGKFRW